MINLEQIHEKKTEIFDKHGIGRGCDWLAKNTRIRPNLITAINILVGLMAAYFLYYRPLVASGLILVMLMVDGFDGYYATRNNFKTYLGEQLDHGGDLLIGIVMLLKSWWHFGEWWILLVTGMYVGEWIILWWLGWLKQKFPERDFLYLFVGGWYWEGLVLQAILQPLILANFVRERVELKRCKIG